LNSIAIKNVGHRMREKANAQNNNWDRRIILLTEKKANFLLVSQKL
jgi:hypothetical protein